MPLAVLSLVSTLTTFPSATPWSGQVLALYDVQCCICQCGQGMETRWRFIYRQAAEESTANTHSRISFSPKENEVTMFSAKWTELEIVLLSGMDHTDTNAVFSVWDLTLHSYTYIGCDSGKGPVRRKRKSKWGQGRTAEKVTGGPGCRLRAQVLTLDYINTKLESLSESSQT